MKTKQQRDKHAQDLYQLDVFFNSLTVVQAQELLHKMFRSAFAQKNRLEKKDVLDLLFMKDEVVKLISIARSLADNRLNRPLLMKFFRWRKAQEWVQIVNDLFYAAVYDGLYTNTPAEKDIYHACRGLLALVAVCEKIYDRDKDKLPG